MRKCNFIYTYIKSRVFPEPIFMKLINTHNRKYFYNILIFALILIIFVISSTGQNFSTR